MPRVNETRFLVQYDLCECEYRLTEIAINWKLKWNQDRCECD